LSADDELREMAANRGYKLVKSRIRTPGKGDHGRFGLKQSKGGKEVFGFAKKGLTAGADDIRAFLRGGSASGWQESLAKAGAARKPTASRKRQPAAAKPEPKQEPKPKPEPKLVIRDARPKDAGAIAALITALGYEVDAASVRRRTGALAKAGGAILVADRGGVVGVLTTSRTEVLHRPKPVGRISLLAVEEESRGAGIGAALVAGAEARLAEQGCGMIEVTSNVKRLRAHAFYRKLGYERTSYRFGKPLKP
jgi:ribosomal protein S18 acetylase RimI-like enzyme